MHYVGRVCTGFTHQNLSCIYGLLSERPEARPPFSRLPSDRNLQKAHWVNSNRLVLDLDPGPGVSWEQLIEGAHILKNCLLEDGIVSFVKTSGEKSHMW